LFTIVACSDPAAPADGSSSSGAPTTSTTSPTTTVATTEGTTEPTDASTSTTAADTTGDTGELDMWRGRGPHGVGHTSTELALVDERTGLVQWWYPTIRSYQGEPTQLSDFEPPGPNRDTLLALLEDAPEPCTRRWVASIGPADPLADDTFPVIVFSHCSNCTRYSSTFIAEQLASWGFVVVAPDHPGNTLFDELAGTSVGVSADFLATRGDDITRVIDAIAQDGTDVPELLQGRLDVARLGVMGHSFGSVTAGWVTERDDRVLATVAIAAPMENPLLPGVTIANIDTPVLMLLAQEDNSILEIGNNLIRGNYDDANAPAWLVEFIDAGHWSYSDICALVSGFDPGCGEGTRQTNGEPFTYVDIDETRARSADWITTFFAAYVLGDPMALAWLGEPPADAAITVESKLE
jgi:predicted dienelactone hydrolase